MANNTLLEKYYVYNKEKEMLAVYKMVDLAAKNDKLSDDTFAVAFEKKCVGANIDAVVLLAIQNTPTIRSTMNEITSVSCVDNVFFFFMMTPLIPNPLVLSLTLTVSRTYIPHPRQSLYSRL